MGSNIEYKDYDFMKKARELTYAFVKDVEKVYLRLPDDNFAFAHKRFYIACQILGLMFYEYDGHYISAGNAYENYQTCLDYLRELRYKITPPYTTVFEVYTNKLSNI